MTGKPGLTAIVLSLAAAGSVAGCGVGTSARTGGTNYSAGATSTPTVSTTASLTKARATAYAHAVNLRAADLPGLRVSQPERIATIGGREGAFAHCVGDTDPRDEIARIQSATLRSPEEFGQINSVVTVRPSAAIAGRNFRATLAPRLLACVKSFTQARLKADAERTTTRYGPVSVSRLRGVAPPPSTGVEIRSSIIVRQLRHAVPVTFDEFAFAAGPAEITLQAEGAPHPMDWAIEQRLVSLLYSRANANKP